MITVKPQPISANFTVSSTTVTEGGKITFTDQSANNPTSWLWTFAGGTPSTSTTKSPVVTYNTPGVYDVTLKAANGNGSDEITRKGYIIVSMKSPIAGFTADVTEIFIGESVQFTDQSQNAQTYTWTFEGGSPSTSSEKNPLVTYNEPGTFKVILMVTSDSGSEELIKTDFISVKSSAVVEQNREISTNLERDFNFPKTSITAYPNPVNDNLFVKLENWKQKTTIRISDLSGRLVYSKLAEEDLVTINVSGFSRGIYLLTVTDGRDIHSQRVTVH